MIMRNTLDFGLLAYHVQLRTSRATQAVHKGVALNYILSGKCARDQ